MEARKRRLAGDKARAATSVKVKNLRREAGALKACVADLTLENRLLNKKQDRGWGRQRTRYPASEKLEIIRIVEQSHLPAKRTREKLGIARRTFCRWFDRNLSGGPEALEDRPSAPGRFWNRIPVNIHDQMIELALDNCEFSSRELVVRLTDERRYVVSIAIVYRLLQAHDLITSPVRCSGRSTMPPA